jgi:hypothetical protein
MSRYLAKLWKFIHEIRWRHLCHVQLLSSVNLNFSHRLGRYGWELRPTMWFVMACGGGAVPVDESVHSLCVD